MNRLSPVLLLLGLAASVAAQPKGQKAAEDPFTFLKDKSVAELKVPEKGKTATFRYVILGTASVEFKPLVKDGETVTVVPAAVDGDGPDAKVVEMTLPKDPSGQIRMQTGGGSLAVGRGAKNPGAARVSGDTTANISIVVKVSRAENGDVKLVVIPSESKGKGK